MTFDDVMEVWRLQDASPLDGVNETLLRLALRQDEAKLQAQRRRMRLITYGMSGLLIAGMSIFLVMIFGMLFYNDDDVITGWDFAIPIAGAAAAVFMSVLLYVAHRTRVLREQRFGDSLRDQLGRRIAQLDDEATRSTRMWMLFLISMSVCAIAILVAGIRVNLELNESFHGWLRIVRIICVFALLSAYTIWAQRRAVKRDVLPRKHRLEALLKELNGQ
jgi:MFS family permease